MHESANETWKTWLAMTRLTTSGGLEMTGDLQETGKVYRKLRAAEGEMPSPTQP